MSRKKYPTHINMPEWRNWQTHTTQNRAGNHVGSNPTFGTKKARLLSCFFYFLDGIFANLFASMISSLEPTCGTRVPVYFVSTRELTLRLIQIPPSPQKKIS